MILMAQTIEAALRPKGAMPITDLWELERLVAAMPPTSGPYRKEDFIGCLLAENSMLLNEGECYSYAPAPVYPSMDKDGRAVNWKGIEPWMFPKEVCTVFCRLAVPVPYTHPSLGVGQGHVTKILLHRIAADPVIATEDTGPAIYMLYNCEFAGGRFVNGYLKSERTIAAMLRSGVPCEGDDLLFLLETALWSGVAHKVWPYLMQPRSDVKFKEEFGGKIGPAKAFGWTGTAKVSDREIRDVISFTRKYQACTLVDHNSGTGGSSAPADFLG